MTKINAQIASNADLALEITDIAEMLDEEFKAASLMIVEGMDLQHVKTLLKGLKMVSDRLNRGMSRMAAEAA